MHKYFKLLAFIGLFSTFHFPLSTLQAQVKWHTVEEAAAAKIGTRLYLVDFYTDWCGYCKKMDRETFVDPTVTKLINKYYYPVKFNAESRKSFTWFGKTYDAAAGRGRVHDFASGVQGYPTTVFYRADGSVFQSVPGYSSAKDYAIILWFFASGDYQRYPFERYQRIFDKEIRPQMEKILNQ